MLDDDTTCDTFETLLSTVTSHVLTRHKTLGILPVTPGAEAVRRTVAALPTHLPEQGRGTGPTLQYLQDDILTGCLTAQNGPRYFGFVTGGVTEAAQLADILGSSYDENVQVTLPDASAATAIESRTLEMVLDLINIPRDTFKGRTITTGATSANILGLGMLNVCKADIAACARDHLYSVSPHLPKGYSYAQSGPPSAPGLPSPPIALLALHPHYSILKAAALVGIGAGPNVVHSLAACPDDELAVDLQDLKRQLAEHSNVGRGVIVSYGPGEVNTGGFGRDLPKVAELCNQYGAWLHVDAAFGGFAAVVPELRHLVQGMDLANSLTLDGGYRSDRADSRPQVAECAVRLWTVLHSLSGVSHLCSWSTCLQHTSIPHTFRVINHGRSARTSGTQPRAKSAIRQHRELASIPSITALRKPCFARKAGLHW